uniref:Uncharacterized protein At4g38062 family n=1 Tax=Cajanus cajan TaxID=3821 RepID=A0A151S850_CAJCA|nr:Uncharacterized protein At4g38062 family [Cajanus cajan]
MKQLELKDAVLIIAQKDNNEEGEKAASLMRQVESIIADELQHFPHNEHDRPKEMPEESTKCQLLIEKDLHMEIVLKEQLKECEKSEMEFELEIWKSFVERLRSDLEENLAMHKKLENSLLAQVDFSESLKQEKDSLASSGETAESSKIDEMRYLQIIEKENISEEFQREVQKKIKVKELIDQMENKLRSSD